MNIKYNLSFILLLTTIYTYSMEHQPSFEELIFQSYATNHPEFIHVLMKEEGSMLVVTTQIGNNEPLTNIQQSLYSAFIEQHGQSINIPPQSSIEILLSDNARCVVYMLEPEKFTYFFQATCNKNDVKHLLK